MPRRRISSLWALDDAGATADAANSPIAMYTALTAQLNHGIDISA